MSYIRFAGGLLKESDAGNFSTDNMASFIKNFINRLKCSYTDDNQFDFEEQIENKLAELVREWEKTPEGITTCVTELAQVIIKISG